MSGFSSQWLALREPVDHASVNAELRRRFVEALAGHVHPHIVEIGCGTGSNVRGLAPWLAGGDVRWTLVDIDQGLLDEAEARLRADGHTVETRCIDLATADLGALFASADAVTSAAFFDLASQTAVETLVDATAAAGAVFYTVLTYDGVAAWLPEHPADGPMREAFNRHQTRDKGMGAALGPNATDGLRRAFHAHSYSVEVGPSPWIVDDGNHDMRMALEDGWAAAVRETGAVDADRIGAWQAHRVEAEAPVTIVGHMDLLALPA